MNDKEAIDLAFQFSTRLGRYFESRLQIPKDQLIAQAKKEASRFLRKAEASEKLDGAESGTFYRGAAAGITAFASKIAETLSGTELTRGQSSNQIAMNSKHTPGPWKWIERHKVLNSATGKVLDSAPHEGMWLSRYNDAEDNANARLIEAAPELLDALRHLIEELDDHSKRTEKARALISRIEKPLDTPPR